MSSVRINLPVQTVTTTVVATTTVTATAAVTTQPPTFPIPGNVYMICSTISNQETWSGSVMTHLDDEVLLTTITDRRSHWLVVEKNGWLGFLNAQSGRFLGHGTRGELQCTARHQHGWEMFHFQPGGRQGQVLLMTHWDRLVPVGLSLHDGKAGLRMLTDGIAGGVVWKFVKVEG